MSQQRPGHMSPLRPPDAALLTVPAERLTAFWQPREAAGVRVAPPPADEGLRLPGALPLVLMFLVWPAVAFAFAGFRTVVLALTGSRPHALAAVVLAVACAATLYQLDGQTLALAVLSALNAPFTVPAIGWGLAHGGALEAAGGVFVVTGMEDGYGPSSGITVGNVFLTGRAEPGAALLSHETVHARQWAVLGALTAPLYGLANAIAGGDPTGNVFEIHAGLREGGYATAGT